MAFTAKVRIANTESAADGQTKLNFTANYTDSEGNRVNQDWAKYTPGFNLTMWVLDEVVEANGIEAGQNYTLTFSKED